MTFIACFRNVPPTGLGITPLLDTFASEVHTRATLHLAQVLQSMPNTSFRVIAALILSFEPLKNFVRLLMTKSFTSLFFDDDADFYSLINKIRHLFCNCQLVLLIVRHLNKQILEYNFGFNECTLCCYCYFLWT